ncbi:hypothetical protein PSA01_20440 [Pseudonocardia saturnea]|uniref:Uncharacterized protein n=1 Tax=Pseudonocardia saturnea TaxID=33909 RepID=A0ABQ0RWG7_9PSEU|nr:hypothetical protein Pdca_11650 [Pseudonocardia autotrophica]GEC25015.1 hypothetical protein PSA01_20440 [Pseudonocardia saturnea]
MRPPRRSPDTRHASRRDQPGYTVRVTGSGRRHVLLTGAWGSDDCSGDTALTSPFLFPLRLLLCASLTVRRTCRECEMPDLARVSWTAAAVAGRRIDYPCNGSRV